MKSLFILLAIFVGVFSFPVKEDSNFNLAIRAMINPDLLEGDILVRKPLKDDSHGFRNAVPNNYYTWPNGVIPYVIDSALDSQRDLILKSMKRIETHTCIRFVEKSDSDQEYVHIIKGIGCYASIGRDLDYPVGTLSLGDGCYFAGTVTHELMHVIGYYHEHNRHDRDDYLNIYWDNIEPSEVDQFTKLRATEERIFTPFDYNSVMLYGPRAFSKDHNSIVMDPKHPGFYMIEVYEKPGLTQLDAESIKKLYNCN